MSMNSVDECKGELRAEMRALRSSLSKDDRERMDNAICAKVITLPQYTAAETVFAYLSFGAEVETRGIIERAWRDGKRVVLPRCTAPREMRWFLVADLDGLEKSSIGVEEPPLNPEKEVIVANESKAIALVPGLTFDDFGYRLGYGGGYYDAFLADFSGTSVGLCRSAQRSVSLEKRGVIDLFDLAVDVVVSD